MELINNQYFKKLFNVSRKMKGIESSFVDANLEEQFRNKNMEKEIKTFTFLTISFCIPSTVFLILSIFINKSFVRSTYLQTLGLILEIILSRLNSRFFANHLHFKLIKILRFFLMYLNVIVNWILPVTPIPENSIRLSYVIILYIGFLYTFFLDFNYILLILIPFINCISIFLSQFSRNLQLTYLLPEIVINLFYFYISFLLKKYNYLHERNLFYQTYRTSYYNEYIQEMVDSFDAMIISVRDQDIIYLNKTAENYFKQNNNLCANQSNSVIFQDFKEKELLKEDDYKVKNEIYTFYQTFLGSLILYSPLNTNYSRGKKLEQILREIDFPKEIGNEQTNNFVKIGYFHSDTKRR